MWRASSMNLRSIFFLHMCVFSSVLQKRYLGVHVGPGQYDVLQPVSISSKVAFEWNINGENLSLSEVVTPTYKNAARQGVPGTPSARGLALRKSTPVDVLRSAGEINAQRKIDFFAKRLHVNKEDLSVSCTYIGVQTGEDALDIGRHVFNNDIVKFQWTLRTPNSEMSDIVSMLCKDLDRGVPLPRCGVTRQRRPVEEIQRIGKDTAQQKAAFFAKKLNVNKEDLSVSCTYLGIRTDEGTIDMGRDACDTDTVEFEWTLKTKNLEMSDSVFMLCKDLDRGIPLPRCGVTRQRRQAEEMCRVDLLGAEGSESPRTYSWNTCGSSWPGKAPPSFTSLPPISPREPGVISSPTSNQAPPPPPSLPPSPPVLPSSPLSLLTPPLPTFRPLPSLLPSALGTAKDI